MSAHAGTAIRAMRTAQRLSLRQLGALAGVDYSTLSKVERGLHDPSSQWLRSVTDALGRHLGGVV